MESDTIFDESGRIRESVILEGLGNGRKTVDGLGVVLDRWRRFFLNVVEEKWGSGFWTVGSGKIRACIPSG